MKLFQRISTYTLLLLGAAVFSAPLLWMVVTALKPVEQTATSPPSWVPYRWYTDIDGQRVNVGVTDTNEQAGEDGTPGIIVQVVHQWQIERGGEMMPVRIVPGQGWSAFSSGEIRVQQSYHHRVTLDRATLDGLDLPDNKRTLAQAWLVNQDLAVSIIDDQAPEGMRVAGFFDPEGEYLMRLAVPEALLRRVPNVTGAQVDASYSETETIRIGPDELVKAYQPYDSYESLAYGEKRSLSVPRAQLERTVAPRWGNFTRSIDEMGMFWQYLRNTLVLCLLTVVGTVISSAMVAYGFSRLDWPGRDKVFAGVLATMMIPFPVLMVPLFALFREMGWIGTLKPLWVPFFFASAFNVFLLRQFFMTIPRDISEAARIDGCSELRIFIQIIVPLAKPALMVVALFQFMATWNDFLGPVIYLTDQADFTLALGLREFQSKQGGTPWHLLMAASTLIVLPVIALFFITQRTFIEGISMTGSKG